MSRCFPFPPPGYEKKARVEDIDLLNKGKSREKKLKKEKERRESKEKRHKDRSDEEKRKEKKEKKEKNREKKKDRDKNKTRTSDEQRLLCKTDNHNGGNLLHKEHKVNDINTFLKKPDTGQSAGYTGAKFIENDHPAEETKRSELLPDSGKSIKDKETEKSSAALSERDDRMVRLVATASSTSKEVLDNIQGSKIDDRKIGVLGIREEARFSTTAMVQKPAATVRNPTGAEVVSRPTLEKKGSKPLEKKVEGRKETKDKNKEAEGSEKRKEKHKDEDKEKKVKSKDKEREKEKKKEEKTKEKVEDRGRVMNESKESNKGKIICSNSTTASLLAEDGSKSADAEGKFRKRKDIETNGFLHPDGDIRPIKFEKLSSSSHPIISENGKTSEPLHTALDAPGTANNLKLDSKEMKINGVIEAQPSASSVKPRAIREVDQRAPQPPKPPHPDCRYLSQIYAVPKVEEWSEFGDQQWLFNSSDSQERKPKSSVVEVPQVWAEAFPIDSADIYALPYVVPY